MFANENKKSFNDKEFSGSIFIKNSKNKLTTLNDLKWINFILIEITFFQILFFGIFSFFSIIICVLQIIIFYKIYKFFKEFPVYENSEIDRISSELNSYSNFIQFIFLVSILEFLLFVFGLINPIGKTEFDGFYKHKFFKISIFLCIIKMVTIYLLKFKINKVNMRAEIINSL